MPPFIFLYNSTKKAQRSLDFVINWHKTYIEWLRNISAGTVDYTGGVDVRPIQWQSAMKLEANKSLVCG